MRLTIVRHGETIENQKGICQGQMDGTLSTTGLHQVRKVAEYLQNVHIDIIFSSDLKRAVDTSKEIHKHHSQIPLIIDKRLRERYFGSYQGKVFPENKKDLIIPDDAESNEMIYSRVLDFFNELKAKHPEDSILIVSHGVTIRAMLAVVQGLKSSYIDSVESVKNCSISIIDIFNNAKPQIITINSIDHL